MKRVIQLAATLFISPFSAYPRYRREKREVLAGLRAGGLIAPTPLGQVEYALIGKGQPVLAVHGSGGGYDQGLFLSHILPREKYLTIAPSRPGYHQTPLTTGRTPELQADALAALLDYLNINKVAVVAISAGGLCAIQFALRHPDRCRALIMLSAATPAIKQFNAGRAGLVFFRLGLSSDFLMWLVLKSGAKRLAQRLSSQSEPLQPAQLAILQGIMEGLFPVSYWREGTLNDVAQVENLSQDSLRQITVPTLVIHGTKDALVPYSIGQDSAAKIPNAQLVTIQDGSHLIVGTHNDTIQTAITDFLNQLPA